MSNARGLLVLGVLGAIITLIICVRVGGPGETLGQAKDPASRAVSHCDAYMTPSPCRDHFVNQSVMEAGAPTSWIALGAGIVFCVCLIAATHPAFDRRLHDSQ